MTEQFPLVECRGWKEICKLLRVRSRHTAKKRLKSLGMYYHDKAGKPYVVVEAYRMAVMKVTLDDSVGEKAGTSK